jgi:chromosome segregation ATPase
MAGQQLADLISSERYRKALEEVSQAIDGAVNSTPYDEPQLCQALEDSVARPLLDREVESSQERFQDLFQIYQEIVEDVLYSLLELGPLEVNRAELLKKHSNTAFTKLLERYEISQREEAALIARYRAEIERGADPAITLQTAVYDIEGANRKLKKELKALDTQLKRTVSELEEERGAVVDEIDENDPIILRGRKIQQEVIEVNSQAQTARQLKAGLEQECFALKEEIEEMMEELVAMDKRAVGVVRKSGKSRK